MERQNAPITLFGIPLKGMITTLFFLLTLFVVFDPLKFKTMFSEKISLVQKEQRGENQSENDNTIVATPEMISKAMSDIRTNKILDYEQTDNVSPTDRFFYIIELHNGGDIEASDVTIEPELVTIVSQSGIQTVIARSTIKKIRRYKLPAPEQPPSTQ
jgi:hypothetical protein